MMPGGNDTFLRFKRLSDIAAALVLLIPASPLMLILSIVIRLYDNGPAIYSQERIGYHGKPFRILKFRTMKVDSEKDGVLLSHSGGDNDPRLTVPGQFLRSHHLDELPQLWNVVKGDMSFVGYRPERKHFIEKIMERDGRYERLFAMRPGITSYATIYNGYTDTMEKMLVRLEYDLDYLEHHSIFIDLKILSLTAMKVLSGKKM